VDWSLLDSSGFMPHGHCYQWQPHILWLHVVSDAVITLAFFSIPVQLVYVVQRSRAEVTSDWVIVLFALFILACGTTHLMEIFNVWRTEYLIAGVIKAITALVSAATAIAMLLTLPRILEGRRERRRE